MEKTRLRNAILNASNRNAALVIKNARVVNVFTETIELADVAVRDGIILGVGQYTGKEEVDAKGAYLCPGLIDGHVHIESSMAHPSRFADCILSQGTTTIIADPHEIANVCGTDGIQYMLDQTEWLPLSVFMMIPSCVPCTSFETSGAKLVAKDMEQFMSHHRVLGLGEVMDYVSTVDGDGEMLDKLNLFRHRPIDGHAPLLSGDALNAYCAAGIKTDHECSEYSELVEKLARGMHLHLRFGSACRGVESLLKQIADNNLPTNRLLFCTDDKHLEDMQREGHINFILRRAVANGISPIKAIQMATVNAAQTYGLRRYGAIAPGYRADFVLFDNLTDFNVLSVYTDGQCFAPGAQNSLKRDPKIYNSVHLAPRKSGVLSLPAREQMPVINLVQGEVLTKLSYETVERENGFFKASRSLLKAAVLERHMSSGRIGLGILKGITIHNGAIASTVGHDSHNLVVVGDNDEDMLLAVDTLESCSGGYVVVSKGKILSILPLPIAGLMSDLPLEQIISRQQELLKAFSSIGEFSGGDPFVTLSFIALPVIPHVRITDMGLFHVDTFSFIQ